MVRLPIRQSKDSQGQKNFLAHPDDKENRKYDAECSFHHPSQSS